MKYVLIMPALAVAVCLTSRDAMGAGPDAAEPRPVASDSPVQQDRSATSGGCEQGASGFISGSTFSVQRLIGMRVTNPINEEIGEVSDLIADECGRIKVMIIHVGGFLGLGGRYVRVALDKVWIRSPKHSPGLIITVRETRENILSDQSAVSQGESVRQQD